MGVRLPLSLAPVLLAGLGVLAFHQREANADDPSGTAAGAAARAPQRISRRIRTLSTESQPLGTNDPLIGLARGGGQAECPAGMADVDHRFCVDRWEGSLVEVGADGQETPWSPFRATEGSHALRAVSKPGVYPQGYISGSQAARACAAAGKRLCAPAEWRKACMGPDQKTFGYGATRIAGRCNDRGRSPMLRYYPNFLTSGPVGAKEMNDPRLNQLVGTLATTGSHEGCTNDYGVYDMVGNLHEWTSDPNGTFQGGYYLDTHRNGDGCTYRTVAHDFVYHDYSTGFRCCADEASNAD